MELHKHTEFCIVDRVTAEFISYTNCIHYELMPHTKVGLMTQTQQNHPISSSEKNVFTAVLKKEDIFRTGHSVTSIITEQA